VRFAPFAWNEGLVRILRPFLMVGLLAAGAAPLLGAAPKAAARDEDAMLQRLARVGGRVEAAVRQVYPEFKKSGRRLSFSLAWDKTLDATSVPEGRVTISTGFMQALAKRPDDELAAVLAHEATHVAERHHGDQGDRITLRAAIEAVHGNEEVERRGSTLAATRYRLNDEYRADAGSVKLLQAAGYDPGAVSDVLKLLEQYDKATTADAPAVAWFANHPDADKRIESADRAVVALAQAAPGATP
jgi:predicted Zn-dependent protease